MSQSIKITRLPISALPRTGNLLFLTARPGFLGPGRNIEPVRSFIADRTVTAMSDLVVGSNKAKFHTAGVIGDVTYQSLIFCGYT